MAILAIAVACLNLSVACAKGPSFVEYLGVVKAAAGPSARDCGVVRLTQPRTEAVACARAALAAKTPFFVVMEEQGIDSGAATSAVLAGDGALSTIGWDSDVYGGGGGARGPQPAITTIRCKAITFYDRINCIKKTSPDADMLAAIASEIEVLKAEYPQLAEFSAQKNVATAALSISYGYRTHKAEPRGGWTSGVPNPDDDGLWFHLDFHDPASTAQIHTQPMTIREQCFGGMKVGFLILEGSKTVSVNGALWRILRRHGVTECASRP
jgi:hypothetical protein